MGYSNCRRDMMKGGLDLESFDYAQDLHLKVDGWANGWIVPESRSMNTGWVFTGRSCWSI